MLFTVVHAAWLSPCLTSLLPRKPSIKKGACQSRTLPFTIRLLQPGPIRPRRAPEPGSVSVFTARRVIPSPVRVFCPWMMHRWARCLISAAAVWKQIVSNGHMQPPQSLARGRLSSASFNRLLTYEETWGIGLLASSFYWRKLQEVYCSDVTKLWVACTVADNTQK